MRVGGTGLPRRIELLPADVRTTAVDRVPGDRASSPRASSDWKTIGSRWRAQLWERPTGVSVSHAEHDGPVGRPVVVAVRPSIATCRLPLTDDVNASIKSPET